MTVTASQFARPLIMQQILKVAEGDATAMVSERQFTSNPPPVACDLGTFSHRLRDYRERLGSRILHVFRSVWRVLQLRCLLI